MLTFRNSLRFRQLFKISSKFNFAQASEKLPVLDGKAGAQAGLIPMETVVQPWVDVESRLTKLRGELVLSDQDKIEKYVLGVVKGYFRTTYKDGITMESNLSDHGLDSLDSIELGMVLEDELGYIIEAETLPQMSKVKHFVNYIKQMEAYKKEHYMLPQERAQHGEENWDDWMPMGEKAKEKLYTFIKRGDRTGKSANKKDSESKDKAKEEKAKH